MSSLTLNELLLQQRVLAVRQGHLHGLADLGDVTVVTAGRVALTPAAAQPRRRPAQLRQ